MCVYHPCTGALPIFSVSFRFYRMIVIAYPRESPTNTSKSRIGAHPSAEQSERRLNNQAPRHVEKIRRVWLIVGLPMYDRSAVVSSRDASPPADQVEIEAPVNKWPKIGQHNLERSLAAT